MGVACLCAVLSVSRAAGALVAWGVTLAAAVVLAHVAGNTLGTRLRDHADRRRAVELTRRPEAQRSEYADRSPVAFAPVTCLSQHRPVGWLVQLGTAVGALAGGGLAFAWLVDPNRSGMGDMILAVAALGVMGGIASFGLSTLLRVGLSAWWQAQASAQRVARAEPRRRWPGSVAVRIKRIVTVLWCLRRSQPPRG